MSIIYLILKILLGLVITLVGLIILIVVLVLTLPIDYIVEFEKYEQINLYSKIKIFYILTIIYQLKEGQNILDFKVLGRKVNQEQEIKETVQETNEDAIQPEKKVTQKTKKPLPSKELTSKTLQDSTVIEKEETRTCRDKELKKEKKKSTFKQDQIKSLWEDIKNLWNNEYRKGFVEGIKKLVIQLFKTIKPRYFKFNIVIGGEDPAQTGEWLAAASLIYPLYGQYGCLQANFEEKGFWGDVDAEGRIRLYKILKVLLVFLINKSVRNYVKTILNIRKEERNGVSIK
ncbi:MAG: hypothetical protein ACRC1P_05730 [Cellulosilyticaceae bacterium]